MTNTTTLEQRGSKRSREQLPVPELTTSSSTLSGGETKKLRLVPRVVMQRMIIDYFTMNC